MIESFMKYESKNIPKKLLEWISKEEIEKNIKKKLDEYFKTLEENTGAQDFMDKINHPGTVLEDYKYHLLSLDGNKKLISSIRFRPENDLLRPFIEIYTKNFDMADLSGEEVKTIIQKYKIFSPEFIRFYENEKADKNSNFEIDYIIYAGHINSLKKMHKPSKYDDVEIKKIDTMDFYENYSNEFDMFNNEKPEQDWFVYKESRETLHDLLTDKNLYYLKIEDKFAGVVGIRKVREKYFEGYMVIEEILYKDFRGQGYGKAVQRKMIDQIRANDNEFIFGFIHPKNKASFKTAGGNGRFETVFSYLLKIKQ